MYYSLTEKNRTKGSEKMNNIKQLRKLQGMTVRDLADKANVAVGYISTLENDSTGNTNPSKDVMEKIAKALNSTVPKIFY